MRTQYLYYTFLLVTVNGEKTLNKQFNKLFGFKDHKINVTTTYHTLNKGKLFVNNFLMFSTAQIFPSYPTHSIMLCYPKMDTKVIFWIRP